MKITKRYVYPQEQTISAAMDRPAKDSGEVFAISRIRLAYEPANRAETVFGKHSP
jgi:hypothetical protein